MENVSKSGLCGPSLSVYCLAIISDKQDDLATERVEGSARSWEMLMGKEDTSRWGR